jgi:hypothetical protein
MPITIYDTGRGDHNMTHTKGDNTTTQVKGDSYLIQNCFLITKSKLIKKNVWTLIIELNCLYYIEHGNMYCDWYLSCHVYERGQRHALSVPLPEIVQQAAVAHELGDDEDGLLVGAHGVQANQLLMAKLLHDARLGHEGFRRHRSRIQRFDGHVRVLVPHT